MERKKELHSSRYWESAYADEKASRNREGQREAILTFVLKGSFLITIGGYREHIVKCGEAILISQGTEYAVQVLEELHFISCRFGTESLLTANCPVKELLPLMQNIEYDFSTIKINDILFKYLNLMNEYFLTGEDNFSFLEMKKIELLYLLFTRYPKHELAGFFYPVLGEDLEFKEFIVNNYLKVKSVPELANLAHSSLSGFEKKFRKIFNESPYNWMMRNKAENIRKDLEMRTTTFQEIAYKYNFSSYRSFLRFCQSQLGLSPSKISNR